MNVKSIIFRMLSVSMILFILCGKSRNTEEAVLASIGDRTISVSDFVNRLEFSPLPPGIDITNQQGRKQALNLLIAEKFFAIEAEKQNFKEDPLVQKKVQVIERSALGRELYREVIRKAVVIEEEKIREAYDKMNEKLVVRFIQTRDLETAQKWNQLLDKGLPFERLLEEVIGEPVSDDRQQIEFTWGQAEPNIEDVAYNMVPGEVSPIISVSNGYIILKLENRIRDIDLSGEKFAVKKNTIEKILRRRAEAVQSGMFVENFMKDKEVVLKGGLFTKVIKELEKWIDFNRDHEEQPKIKIMMKQEIDLTDDRLEDHLDNTLVEFKGGGWTVRSFLEKLWLMEVPLSSTSRKSFKKSIQESIRILVRDELLAEEAFRRGLLEHDTVQDDISMWKDNFLYITMKNSIMERKDDPWLFYLNHKHEYSIEVDENKLRNLELTTIPVIAVWTNFQRQLTVPLWPQLLESKQ